MSVPTVYLNGKVVTVDGAFSVAEAFAVDRNRFAAVGSNARMRAFADDTGASVVDLDGRMALPGFIDGHPHTIFRGLLGLAHPDLAGLHSIAEIAARIEEAAAITEPGEWIATSPIGEPPDYFHLPESLVERRWPTRDDLDEAAPENPVYIPTSVFWPHPAIFNSAALAALGIDRTTPDEDMMRIGHSENGEPNGRVHGLTIFNPSRLNSRLQALLPQVPTETRRAAIATAIRDNLAIGVTTIYEAHTNFFVPDLRAIHSTGLLANRVVNAYEFPATRSMVELDQWMAGLDDALGEGTGDDQLTVVGATLTIDAGGPAFGGMVMHKPYLNVYDEVCNGTPTVSTEQLVDIARLAVRHRLRLNIIAGGDKACTMATDALEIVDRESPLVERHWVLQHALYPTREQLAKLGAMGIVAQTCPSTDYTKGVRLYLDKLSDDRWETLVPLRWWMDEGVPVAQACDAARPEPMFQLWASLRRVDGETGRSMITPAKAITRAEAIRMHTCNGALLVGWGDRLGSIEKGKLADFVVLDRDILECPVDEIRETTVLLTALDGTVVHDPTAITSP
ncbi:amidohydrolase [Pseudonocardia spinosispora]|uniref:amidohydrolase n=1 Tax=Pseudonocardia spinosispora TaxID=103441 RepID=UPI0003FD7978|nr:amidohydrolase family protein [Pseudonocardia spinosispora]